MRRLAALLGVAAMGVSAAAQAHDPKLHEALPTSLPVGDGKVSTSPRPGYVMVCSTRFGGGGARATGDWFHGTSWNPLEKPHVQGSILWPEARFEMHADGSAVQVDGNGLPVGQPTGKFPISPSDPAYKYDTNPNSIRAHLLALSIPAAPVRASSPGCLPMGMIGFTETGVALYNALDAGGRDAAAHEIQDKCDGHPQMDGQYHYHSGSPCMPGHDANAVVGWALDGYPIMGMRDAGGKLIRDTGLDACHGRAEALTIAGRHYDYAYRLTPEYPYIIGCFTGRVPDATLRAVRPGGSFWHW